MQKLSEMIDQINRRIDDSPYQQPMKSSSRGIWHYARFFNVILLAFVQFDLEI